MFSRTTTALLQLASVRTLMAALLTRVDFRDLPTAAMGSGARCRRDHCSPYSAVVFIVLHVDALGESVVRPLTRATRWWLEVLVTALFPPQRAAERLSAGRHLLVQRSGRFWCVCSVHGAAARHRSVPVATPSGSVKYCFLNKKFEMQPPYCRLSRRHACHTIASSLSSKLNDLDKVAALMAMAKPGVPFLPPAPPTLYLVRQACFLWRTEGIAGRLRAPYHRPRPKTTATTRVGSTASGSTAATVPAGAGGATGPPLPPSSSSSSSAAPTLVVLLPRLCKWLAGLLSSRDASGALFTPVEGDRAGLARHRLLLRSLCAAMVEYLQECSCAGGAALGPRSAAAAAATASSTSGAGAGSGGSGGGSGIGATATSASGTVRCVWYLPFSECACRPALTIVTMGWDVFGPALFAFIGVRLT